MPLDTLEQHPFLSYWRESDSEIQYTGLIIGSFPVYACTDTLNGDLTIREERFDSDKANMRFFYGSKISRFWRYCSSAFNEVDPTIPLLNDPKKNFHVLAKERAISVLNRNNLLITDTIFRTNRLGKKDEDSNLLVPEEAPAQVVANFSLNHSLPDLLGLHGSITNLFFTATVISGKCPFGWFKDIFAGHMKIVQRYFLREKIWSLVCDIHGRLFNVFLLPTPKSRGIHFTDNSRNEFFINYLQSVDANFYERIKQIAMARRSSEQVKTLSMHRENFLREAYRQALVNHNLQFDGNVLG